MYGAQDPSIAGMVLDSPFANLNNLMMELVDVYKIRLPKFTVIFLDFCFHTNFKPTFCCFKCLVMYETMSHRFELRCLHAGEGGCAIHAKGYTEEGPF